MFFTFIGEFRKAVDLIEEKGTSGLMGISAAWFYLLNTEEDTVKQAEDLITKLWT